MCLIIVGITLTLGSAAGQPALDFRETSVAARGLSAGGATVWLAVSLEQPEVYVRLVTRRHVLTDTDRDGATVLELGTAVPARSVWAVVDLAAGQLVLGSPDVGQLQQQPLPEGAIHRLQGEGIDAVTLEGRRVEVLLARRGVGAWGARVGDGGPLDRDGSGDGKLVVAFSDLPMLTGGERAPATVQTGDVFVAVDRESLAVVSYVGGEGR